MISRGVVMARILCWVIGICLSGSPLSADAQSTDLPNPAPSTAVSQPAQGKLLVAEKTTIPVVLKNHISTRTAYVGQNIYCETTFPVTAENRIVIPVGTYVKGSVTQVVRPGRIRGKAKLGLRFDSFVFPDGLTVSLRSALSAAGTSGKEGFDLKEGRVKGAGSEKEDTQIIAVSGVQGALIGAVAGRSGKGAAIGGAVGAGVGLASVLLTRGKDVELPPGTSLELILLLPLELPRYE